LYLDNLFEQDDDDDEKTESYSSDEIFELINSSLKMVS
jgi:hypothetical protein